MKRLRHPQNRKYITQRRQRGTETGPQAACTKKLAKFGRAAFELCERTDKQTDILITILRTLPEGELIDKTASTATDAARTVFEGFFVGQQLPQEDAKAVDVELNGALVVDVLPVLWWNVTDSASGGRGPAVCMRRRVVFPLGQTEVTDL